MRASQNIIPQTRNKGMTEGRRQTVSTEEESEENPPELRHKLQRSSEKAFEFLWRNVAGSTVPTEMEEKSRSLSYLKLFPGSRPLVLAQKQLCILGTKKLLSEIQFQYIKFMSGQTYKVKY
ncbi:hypothetical protein Leryth_007593 [Lithospermum erythrorhizon]|nr:hypothetical protein Leryth_007593 [Lithospermum erythrorhizon]